MTGEHAVAWAAFFVSLVSTGVRTAASLREYPTMTKWTIAVEHVRIEPANSFADVRAARERSVAHLDPGVVKALADGDVARVNLDVALRRVLLRAAE
jgi:hypothetical protein